MRLTVAQRFAVYQGGELGMSLFDSLVVAGIPPAEAEKVQRDPVVTAYWRDGRAAGARDIRTALAREARAGNVSAMKALNLHTPDGGWQSDGEERPSALVRIPHLAESVRARFQAMRELQEAADAEANAE